MESSTIGDYLTFFFEEEGMGLEVGEYGEDAVKVTEGFFGRLAEYIKKKDDDEEELSALKSSLQSISDHLSKTSTPYLTSTTLSTLDLQLAPQLHHLAVTLNSFKTNYTASECFTEFPEVEKYYDTVTKERPYLAAKDYDDEVIVWGWENAREGKN